MSNLPLGLLALSAALVLMAGCDEDGAGTEQSTPTAVFTASPTILNPELATVVPPPSPLSTPVVIPPYWHTFSSSEVGDFTFRYPSGWFPGVSTGRLSSFDPSNSPNVHYFPSAGTAIEVGRVTLDAPGIAPRPDGAVDTVLDGAPGWEIVFTYTGSDVVRRIHTLHVDHNGYRYYILGYFGQPDADETVFLQILSTFKFVS